MSLPSLYQFLTESDLKANSAATTTATVTGTNTDPDRATTTLAVTATGTPQAVAEFPPNLPLRMFPAERLSPDDPILKDKVLISILYTEQLGWLWVTGQQNTAAQLLVYTPDLICNALAIDCKLTLYGF